MAPTVLVGIVALCTGPVAGYSFSRAADAAGDAPDVQIQLRPSRDELLVAPTTFLQLRGAQQSSSSAAAVAPCSCGAGGVNVSLALRAEEASPPRAVAPEEPAVVRSLHNNEVSPAQPVATDASSELVSAVTAALTGEQGRVNAELAAAQARAAAAEAQTAVSAERLRASEAASAAAAASSWLSAPVQYRYASQGFQQAQVVPEVAPAPQLVPMMPQPQAVAWPGQPMAYPGPAQMQASFAALQQPVMFLAPQMQMQPQMQAMPLQAMPLAWR